MGEFDESYDSEAVDTSDSFDEMDGDTADDGGWDTGNDMSDTLDEDVTVEGGDSWQEADTGDDYEEDWEETPQENYDESSGDDYQEDSNEADAGDGSSQDFAEDQDEVPQENSGEAGGDDSQEQADESQMSPSELREKADREAEEAQREAEQWADENDMETWSDGTPRAGYGDSGGDQQIPDDTARLEAAEGQEATEQAARQADERAAFEADVKREGDELNKEYMDLMNRKQAAFDATVDVANTEDLERFANMQRDLGEQMDDVRRRIMENNNRLK